MFEISPHVMLLVFITIFWAGIVGMYASMVLYNYGIKSGPRVALNSCGITVFSFILSVGVCLRFASNELSIWYILANVFLYIPWFVLGMDVEFPSWHGFVTATLILVSLVGAGRVMYTQT